MKKVIIYQYNLYKIGGIESFIYYFTNELKKYYDVELIYEYADSGQLRRLNIPYHQNNKRVTYNCDYLIKTSHDGSPDNIYAIEYIQMVHANYSELPNFKFHRWNRIENILCVSDTAKESFLELYPNEKKIDVIYNFISGNSKQDTNKKNNKLTLLSATRLTEEKGCNRIRKLSELLDEAKIDYEWNIYTNSKNEFLSKNINKCNPKLDLTEEMVNADYVIQLSDCESFCYTVHESLYLGTPVIVTDWKGIGETVKDGYNGYILDMDLSNVDINRVINNIPSNFKYKQKGSIKDWIEYFNKLDEERKKMKMLKVKTLISFNDVKERKTRRLGEVFIVSEDRYKEINNCDYCKQTGKKLVEAIIEEEKLQEIVEEVKTEIKEEKKKKTTKKK